ncbi:MAG: L7Ae/L30e/S12e/Gadd45 family ribosomal protein [Porcipelethomonas sp.]
MNSQQKTINLLTICRKSGRVVMGFDAVKAAALQGNISCVLVTDDVSLKTLKEVKFFCNNTQTEIIKVDLVSADMFTALGKEVVVAGVADRGFANRFRELGTPVKATVPRSMKKRDE